MSSGARVSLEPGPPVAVRAIGPDGVEVGDDATNEADRFFHMVAALDLAGEKMREKQAMNAAAAGLSDTPVSGKTAEEEDGVGIGGVKRKADPFAPIRPFAEAEAYLTKANNELTLLIDFLAATKHRKICFDSFTPMEDSEVQHADQLRLDIQRTKTALLSQASLLLQAANAADKQGAAEHTFARNLARVRRHWNIHRCTKAQRIEYQRAEPFSRLPPPTPTIVCVPWQTRPGEYTEALARIVRHTDGAFHVVPPDGFEPWNLKVSVHVMSGHSVHVAEARLPVPRATPGGPFDDSVCMAVQHSFLCRRFFKDFSALVQSGSVVLENALHAVEEFLSFHSLPQGFEAHLAALPVDGAFGGVEATLLPEDTFTASSVSASSVRVPIDAHTSFSLSMVTDSTDGDVPMAAPGFLDNTCSEMARLIEASLKSAVSKSCRAGNTSIVQQTAKRCLGLLRHSMARWRVAQALPPHSSVPGQPVGDVLSHTVLMVGDVPVRAFRCTTMWRVTALPRMHPMLATYHAQLQHRSTMVTLKGGQMYVASSSHVTCVPADQDAYLALLATCSSEFNAALVAMAPELNLVVSTLRVVGPPRVAGLSHGLRFMGDGRPGLHIYWGVQGGVRSPVELVLAVYRPHDSAGADATETPEWTDLLAVPGDTLLDRVRHLLAA